MATEEHFLFQITFRGPYGQRAFSSHDDLLRWIDEQSEYYKPFSGAKLVKNEEPLSGLLARIAWIGVARDALVQAKAAARRDQGLHDNHMAQVRKRLDLAFSDRGLPPSPSVEVEALRPYAKRDPVAAITALHCLMDHSTEPAKIPSLTVSEPAIARGIGLAAFVRLQLFDQNPNVPATQVIDNAVTSFAQYVDETRSELVRQLTAANELVLRLQRAWESRDKEFEKLSSQLSNDIGSAIDTAATSVQSFKEAYQAEIAFKEPVTFWAQKSVSHRNSERAYGGVALTTAAVAAYMAVSHFPILLITSKDAPPPYYGIAVVVAVSTLVLWLLRVLVRSYLAQSHLKTDAEERVAMVKTYLALLESGKAPAESLGPVLTALFRPASDGLVKDDSMPVSIAELLTKQSK